MEFSLFDEILHLDSKLGCTYKWSTFEFEDVTFQDCLTNKNKTSLLGLYLNINPQDHWKKQFSPKAIYLIGLT